MSVPTTNRNYPFPDEWMNPYYDDFWDMFEAIDQDVQDAWDSIAGNATMDAAYDNFGALPAIVEVDGAEGQGDLVFEIADTTSFVVDLESIVGVGVDGFRIINGSVGGDYFQFIRGGANLLNIEAQIHDYQLQGSGSWEVDVVGDITISTEGSIEIGCDDYMELYSEQDLTIEWSDASTWTGLDASLTIQTDTTGNIELTAAEELALTWEAESVWSGNGAGLEIETNTSGDIAIVSAETLSLDWSAASIWTGNDASLTIQTITGGDIGLDSASDLGLECEGTIDIASDSGAIEVDSGTYIDISSGTYIEIQAGTYLGFASDDGPITFSAVGGAASETAGFDFTWDGQNDCVFDMANCDVTGEAPDASMFSIEDDTDWFRAQKVSDGVLLFDMNAESFDVDTDYNIDFTAGLYLNLTSANRTNIDGPILDVEVTDFFQLWVNDSTSDDISGSIVSQNTGTGDANLSLYATDNLTMHTQYGELHIYADAGNVTLESKGNGAGDHLNLISNDDMTFEDTYLSSPITLSEIDEAVFDTTSQSIVGSTNELVATIGALTFDDIYDNTSGDHIVTVDDGDLIFRLADTEIFSLQSSSGSDDYISITGASTTGLSVDMDIADLDINMSATLELDSVGNSYWAVGSGDLDFSTTTSGDMNLASVGDVTFVDQWLVGLGAISLSESGGTKLDTTSQSIVGAINEIFGLLP